MARPIYRKKKISHSSEFSDGGNDSGEVKVSSVFTETPAMLVPSISPSVSVREAIQEVKMVQVFSPVLIGCKCGFSLSPRMHKHDTYVYCCNRTLPVLPMHIYRVQCSSHVLVKISTPGVGLDFKPWGICAVTSTSSPPSNIVNLFTY